MARKLLPIGIQTFSRLREDDAYYVDKTRLILSLIQGARVTFSPARGDSARVC